MFISCVTLVFVCKFLNLCFFIGKKEKFFRIVLKVKWVNAVQADPQKVA
jgi:hypothetical protein